MVMRKTAQENYLWGGIEGGGTKFNCVLARNSNEVIAEARIPTTSPQATFSAVLDFFSAQTCADQLAALGLACFGPLDLNPTSPSYGYITQTTKAGWSQVDLLTPLKALGVPVVFDTDVNGAALGEHLWGAAQGLDTFIYLTVGTGIGGGAMLNGKLAHGLTHPEMGHLLLPHDYESDPYPGNCPYHGDCLEGLACGPAVTQRWGQAAETLSPDHPAWELEAHYLALALVNYTCTLSPHKIILGGGVMQTPHLIDKVRDRVREYLHGYLSHPYLMEEIDQYIVAPGLGGQAGVLGAVGLAQQAFYQQEI